MKDFVGLQSSFFLCVLLAFSEQESGTRVILVFLFWAVAEPTLLDQDHFWHSDEVSLGTGCLVTDVTEKGYVFNCPVTEYGSQKELIMFGDHSKHHQNNLAKFRNDPPSAISYSPWNITNTCLFGLLQIPHFQDSLVESSSQSLLLNMPHPLVHEYANMAMF
ncbi:oocyte-secreted protein 3 [Lemur catta]|uniref:oocyte-secreted protein 3 n=1 Tax=Lemur catta TaxID=9447 RepID=UPI001E2668D4|nr:oocyte-secreted protein 3 [Lemur catta]